MDAAAGPRAWFRLVWLAALVSLLLGLLALGPGLGRGFLLSYDMVAVPRQPFTAAIFGWGGALPRAVPSDAVAAAAARVLPADVVQKLFLLAIFVLAGAGLATLLAGQHWLARLAGAVCYTWNPYVAERLIIGQWALLLGYAGLPWVLAALTRPAATWWRWAGRLTLALLPAAIGGFSAMCITALVALPVALCSPGGATPRTPPIAASRRTPARREHACGAPRLAAALAPGPVATGGPASPANVARRLRSAGLALLVLTVLSLPWLVPALSQPVYTSPAGVAAFAARADTPFGAVGSLLMLGGGWNAQTVPTGYGGLLATPWLVFALAALAAYLVLGRARWPGLTFAAAAGLVIACLGLTGPGRALLQAMIGAWPGFAVLRDGQQFIAPLALAEAAGAGLGTAWLLRLRRPAAVADLRHLLAAVAVLAPVVLLPGLAWGAAGRLRPVQYPAGWLAARQLIDADRAPGRALLLPWAAYRRFGWNHGEAVLDPWPRLLSRPVIFNDGVQVGSAQIPPEDPQARMLNALITSGAPLTARLRQAGVRFVIVDAGFGQPAPFGGGPGRYPFRGRLPGAQVRLAGPGLVVYQLPSG